MIPLDGLSMAAKILSKVVLPEPLSPTREKISPFSTFNVILPRADIFP